MIKSLLLLGLLLPSAAFATIDYRLDIELQPAEQRLIASALINFNDRLESPLRLQLDQRCEIIAVQQADRALSYNFSAGILKLEPTGNEPLSISYRGVFNDQASNTPVHNEDPSYGVSATISADGSFLSSGTNWYPRLADKGISYRVSVSAPAGIEAITSGKRIYRQTDNDQSRSVWLIDYPVNGVTLSAGHYQVFEDLAGSVPIYAYFYPESSALAATYLQAASNYLQLYGELFGPYPFHKFAIVENFFPTGYGFPSWTLLGSSVIKLPFIVKTSLGHEIAHSWWGTGVRVDYAQGNWAEGLTTYVADYLYKERSSAAEAYEYRLNILRDYANLVDAKNTFAIASFSSRNDKASQAIGYGKTAMFFHMLRQRIGDQAFWGGLRKLSEERMFTQVGWDDFRKLFSSVSGENLQVFFHQWLTTTEGPQLALQEVEMVATASGWKVTGKLSQKPVYQLAVKLQLTTENGGLSNRLQLTSSSQRFEFNSKSRPVTLQADPDAEMFRILAAEEIPSTINSIRGSDQLLVLQAGKQAPDSAAQKTLLGGMRKAQLSVRPFTQATKQELATNDLLIFGLPEQFSPTQLRRAANGQFSLEGQTGQFSEHSAFIVQRNPLNPEKSAAWFISEDPQAAVVARKIPHYGKYSYLWFAGSTNSLKGVGATESSPLKFNF